MVSPSHTAKLLVVEDDPTLREAICDTLVCNGHNVVAAQNGLEALQLIDSQPIEMVISDVQMDVMDGYQLLQNLKKSSPSIPVVMITAHAEIQGAIDAMKAGASDYLQKPFQAEVLLAAVERFAPLAGNEEVDLQHTGIVAEDEKTKRVIRIAERVAQSDATVLLSGESGTGKEVIAKLIHENSPRKDKPFIAVNCAAIPENMLESMLFGYEKGAYTGAHQSRPGKFEQANGGTILLDEISEMEIGLQAKLLRVLQEREVERLGGSKLIPLNVRVLATTNRNLREEVNEGRFREDLFYRLSVFPMELPPLRERAKDIIPLATFLLEKHTAGAPVDLNDDARESLSNYAWPGNVRELENCVQRALILSEGTEITAADIEFEFTGDVSAERDEMSVSDSSPDSDGLLGGNLKATENQTILDALISVQGNRKIAADKLGISPRTLRYKIARLREDGIRVPQAMR